MADILEILLDENNIQPIHMVDNKGKEVAFQQICVVPYDKGGDTIVYAILKPMEAYNNVPDDGAFVFRAEEDEFGETVLKAEMDEKIAVEIFVRYYKLMKEKYHNNANVCEIIQEYIEELKNTQGGDEE